MLCLLGLGSVIGPLFRGSAIAEHQQQVTATVQGRRRHCPHNGKRLARVVNHFFDRCHRITGRETLPQARADQQVAHFDIRSVCNMTQFQALRITRTAGNRAQAITVYLHRNAVGRIGEQQDTRGVGHQLDHLPHQPTGIKHGLPQYHAVALTFVDDDAMGEGVRVHADQLGHFNLFVDQRG